MGLFSSSKTSVTNTTQNIADSNNRTQSRTDIVADSGNTTVNLAPSASAPAGDWKRYLPLVAMVSLALAALLWFLRKGKA
jgi:hypothetical protein